MRLPTQSKSIFLPGKGLPSQFVAGGTEECRSRDPGNKRVGSTTDARTKEARGDDSIEWMNFWDNGENRERP